MGKPIIEDELWALIEPLLPAPKPRGVKYPSRKPVTDRAALACSDQFGSMITSGIPLKNLEILPKQAALTLEEMTQ